MIRLYTDGAALGNPGPGGYGALLMCGAHKKEIVGGARLTTNNRMELLAVIAGLEAIRDRSLPVHVYSDSRYVVDAVNKRWLDSWVREGFRKKKNPDLWTRFWELSHLFPSLTFSWVKGHSGHPENERCDQLATQYARSMPQEIDEAFERDRASQG